MRAQAEIRVNFGRVNCEGVADGCCAGSGWLAHAEEKEVELECPRLEDAHLPSWECLGWLVRISGADRSVRATQVV